MCKYSFHLSSSSLLLHFFLLRFLCDSVSVLHLLLFRLFCESFSPYLKNPNPVEPHLKLANDPAYKQLTPRNTSYSQGTLTQPVKDLQDLRFAMEGDTIITVPAPNATIPIISKRTSESTPLLMANNEEEQEELWNEPRINAYRYFSSLYAFMAMGMNDAAYGASIPI